MRTSHAKHRPPGRARRRAAVVGVALAATLIAAACGSDKKAGPTTGGATTTTAGSATTTPGGGSTATTPPGTGGSQTTVSIDPKSIKNGQGVSDTEIKIGMVMDLSGPYAAYTKDLRAAFDAKVSLINDNGGVAGRKIVTLYSDTKSDAATNLQAFKKLWEQDKVLGIYTLDAPGPPLDYVQKNNIPVTTLGGLPALFSSKYPSILPSGSLTTAWGFQSAYALIHFKNIHPKVVAVTYQPDAEKALLPWADAEYKKLGVEKVLFDPYPDPTAPCDALVLKYKNAGVDMWIQNGAEFLTCIPAELALGWSPPMGQGGQGSSALDQAMLIGKPMSDLKVLGGSPGLRADGSPTYLKPAPIHVEYQAAMLKYAPDLTKTKDISDWVPESGYLAAKFFEDAILGAAAQSGEIGPDTILKWAQSQNNYDPGLTNPVKSMKPNCKTGNDATIWGTWVWDDATKKLHIEYFAPKPGDPMVTTFDADPTLDPCYLTQLADEFFAK